MKDFNDHDMDELDDLLSHLKLEEVSDSFTGRVMASAKLAQTKSKYFRLIIRSILFLTALYGGVFLLQFIPLGDSEIIFSAPSYTEGLISLLTGKSSLGTFLILEAVLILSLIERLLYYLRGVDRKLEALR